MKALYPIFAVLTAVIGMQIHGSYFWAVADFFFWPFTWAKWLVCHEVSMPIIKAALSWFF